MLSITCRSSRPIWSTFGVGLISSKLAASTEQICGISQLLPHTVGVIPPAAQKVSGTQSTLGPEFVIHSSAGQLLAISTSFSQLLHHPGSSKVPQPAATCNQAAAGDSWYEEAQKKEQVIACKEPQAFRSSSFPQRASGGSRRVLSSSSTSSQISRRRPIAIIVSYCHRGVAASTRPASRHRFRAIISSPWSILSRRGTHFGSWS